MTDRRRLAIVCFSGVLALAVLAFGLAVHNLVSNSIPLRYQFAGLLIAQLLLILGVVFRARQKN